MKISEVISELKAAKELLGDAEVYTAGYFGANEVESVGLVTKGELGKYLDANSPIPDTTPAVVFYPENLP